MFRPMHLVFFPVLALLFLISASDASGTGTSTPEELVLESGMRVLLFPQRGSGLVASNVFVGAGSTREEERYAGSSHFLEHVLFNGTTRRTQEELYAATDRIGAYNNATTGREYTHYMMVAPFEHLAEPAVDQRLVVHSTETFLGKRRPGAVAYRSLQAVAVPVRYRHRGVDRPAAGVIGPVHGVDRGGIEVAVSVDAGALARRDIPRLRRAGPPVSSSATCSFKAASDAPTCSGRTTPE